ncbi:ISKra4 family transposase [Aestuariibius sp. 2305UL40-4]|uniref:ISKra4 family transposase n=1 Tax=Aestuariibius violaceus TaxID=3234132 RepID=UPI00345E07D2
MDVRIIVETTADTGNKRTHELRRFSLSSRGHGDMGLKLEDAKDILGQLQKAVLNAQVENISQAHRRCTDCGCTRRLHDYRTKVLDTLLGRFRVRVPRLHTCSCEKGERGSISPFSQLFPNRATQELPRLQAELGARHSFREAARILETFLPCAAQHNTTVRNRLGRVAEEITEPEPEPVENNATTSHPVTVLVDGAHIRCRPEYQKRHLDVVVGKIEAGNMCRRFGLAPQAAASPTTQLRHELVALGWNGRRSVTVISDGEAALPNLFRGATDGKVRHILDWWHISMRVQHVENAIKGLLQTEDFPGVPVIFRKPAETLRWYLWHGKVQTAGTDLQWLIADCASLSKQDHAVRDAASRAIARCNDLYCYLANNMDSLTNYGRRYRKGLPISTSRAEGCVDDIGNARMGKHRRMRWSPRGAHNVAVARAAVLDGHLSISNTKRAA